MGLLSRIIRDAVGEGISKGIRDAVGKAAESVVAPKAEAYANKVAASFDHAAGNVEATTEATNASIEGKAGSSLEASLERLSQSAEKYAATLEKAAASQENMITEWNEKLPGFPVWCFGGTKFWFETTGNTSDGNPYWSFCAENTTQEGLDLYVALLKENGFVRKYQGSDEILYKDLGGEYLIFGKTDAFGTAPVMMVSMVRTCDRSEIE